MSDFLTVAFKASVCVLVWVYMSEWDLSSGITLTIEKVKIYWPAQTGRQLVRRKTPEKNGKVTTFNTFWKSSKSHQRDRDIQKRRQDQCCASLISGQLMNQVIPPPFIPCWSSAAHLWPKNIIQRWYLGAEDEIHQHSPKPTHFSVMHAHSWITGIFCCSCMITAVRWFFHFHLHVSLSVEDPPRPT